MAADDLVGHHRWDHHAAAPARRRHAARARSCGADLDVDLCGRLLRVRGLDSLADCTGLLLHTLLHEDNRIKRNKSSDKQFGDEKTENRNREIAQTCGRRTNLRLQGYLKYLELKFITSSQA